MLITTSPWFNMSNVIFLDNCAPMVTQTHQTNTHKGRQADCLLHSATTTTTRQSSGFPPYQLAEFIGQLLDHHTEALQLLKHADQVLTGEAADHLQVFTRAKTQGERSLIGSDG